MMRTRPTIPLALSRCALLALVVFSSACGDDSAVTPDGAMDDGGTDVGPECLSARECDDGLFCNGVETCSEAGVCVAGEDVFCDDEVACTTDFCDDEIDRCVSAAPDLDGDGSGDASCVDGEGNPLGADCNDDDPLTFPGNPEVCDFEGHDEDCDPETIGRRDVDGDGFTDAVCCNGDLCGTDCDDLRANTNPATTEVCDRVDNDCDGLIDEGVLISGFVDADRDGFGDGTMPLEACASRAGFVAAGGPLDCDDTDLAVNPGQVEICDGRDNDCDDATTDADGRPVEWFRDADGDGFGSRAGGIVTSCEPVAGHSLRDSDCDDDDGGIHPAAAEACNGLDDDCNGAADFEVAPGDFEDDDGDGLLDLGCGALGTDCDDRDPTAGPGSEEACDGRDNDCDELVDEGADDRSWFADIDGDGFGTNDDPDNPVIRSCVPPPRYVGNVDDCADRDPDRFPGAVETCNRLDDDCDRAVDEDGVCGCPAGLSDCDGDGSCETDTRSDAANCGGCGSVCAMESGVVEVACRASVCRVERCAPGRGDCDGFARTGCESFLSDDPANCGGCDRGCFADFGTGVLETSCDGGACQVAFCDDGLGDCNGRIVDGCERPLLNDPLNCGGCGVVCPSVLGPPRCESGSCVAPCVPGQTADCDGDPRNGCETALDTMEHCGGCGTVCPAPAVGLSSACVRRSEGAVPRCEVHCEGARADCNDDLSDGCEATITEDACGCPGDTIVNCAAAFGFGNSGRCEGGFGEASCVLETCAMGEVCDGACADIDGDPANCGGCGFECGGGGTCVAGTCECGALDSCDGRCVDSMSDPFHCGGCDRPCAASEVCDAGTCRLECTTGLTDCGGGCVDTRTDFFHCGGCSNPCNSIEACERGACVLTCSRTGLTSCGSACADLEVDDQHCGACGNACPAPGAGASSIGCEDFACRTTCDAGLADCDADPTTCETSVLADANNCGGCGIDCGMGGVCTAGVCDTIVQVDTSSAHSCAVRSSGNLVCWGQNDNRQLGVAAPTRSATPVQVPLTGVTDVALGQGFSCAIAFDGGSGEDRVHCWGTDAQGERGDGGGAEAASEVPQVHVPPAGFFPVSVVVGTSHGCALYEDSGGATALHCWGEGENGQSGNGVLTDRYDQGAVALSPSVAHVIASGHGVCVEPVDTTGGLALTCFGANVDGQLTRTASAREVTPAAGATMPFERIEWLAMGDGHGCVVVGGRPWCWGSDASNQIGTGGTSHIPAAAPPIPGARIEELSMDANATCALTDAGAVYCRGENPMGRLVTGGPDPVTAWTRINALGFAAVQLSDGAGAHRCAIVANGDVFCWGQNTDGQTGHGTLDETAAPVRQVVDLTD